MSNRISGIEVYGSGSSFPVADIVVPLATTLLVIGAVGYGIYLIILGIKHGADKVLASLQSVRKRC